MQDNNILLQIIYIYTYHIKHKIYNYTTGSIIKYCYTYIIFLLLLYKNLFYNYMQLKVLNYKKMIKFIKHFNIYHQDPHIKHYSFGSLPGGLNLQTTCGDYINLAFDSIS